MRVACWQAAGRRVGRGTLGAGLAGAAARARAAGASLLVTPEMSLTGYEAGTRPGPVLAEDLRRTAVTGLRALAREHGLALVGGWPETDGDVVHNSVALVTAAGDAVVYRKTHLFGTGERAAFTPGDGRVVQIDLDGVRVGLLVCYDVEFPEAVRAHAVAGTELLVVPTALPRADLVVARTVVPARAFENGLYLAYVNWTGREDTLDFGGSTRVVGPDARLRADAGEAEGVVVADVDRDAIDRARAATPYLCDRRPDLWATATADDRR